MRAKAFLILICLAILAAGCGGNDQNGTSPNPDDTGGSQQVGVGSEDQAQQYAAAIREIYYVDHSFGEPPAWPLVYAISQTDDSAMGGDSAGSSVTLSLELQESIAAALSGEPFELIWISSMDDAPIDPSDGGVAGGEGIVISLGNVHPQRDGSVELSFFMTCGGLCGIGKVYVLNQVSGNWQVTGSVGPTIMS